MSHKTLRFNFHRTTIAAVFFGMAYMSFSAPVQAQVMTCITRLPSNCSGFASCVGDEIESGRVTVTTLGRNSLAPCNPPAEGVVCCTPVPVPERPDCVWRGTAPFCKGSCLRESQRQVGPRTKKGNSRNHETANNLAINEGFTVSKFGKRCWKGTKVLCCPR